jgi:hypothetical protein
VCFIASFFIFSFFHSFFTHSLIQEKKQRKRN